MTIKDAEKLTGLTIKSIRYYEEKGLINIERNNENDYRKYTEDDIDYTGPSTDITPVENNNQQQGGEEPEQGNGD